MVDEGQSEVLSASNPLTTADRDQTKATPKQPAGEFAQAYAVCSTVLFRSVPLLHYSATCIVSTVSATDTTRSGHKGSGHKGSGNKDQSEPLAPRYMCVVSNCWLVRTLQVL